MDNLTIQRAQSPSFTAIKLQNGLLNNKNRKAVSEYISNKLNSVDVSDKAKRTFVQRAENYGYDVLLTKGQNKNSVRVDVVSTLAEQKAAVWNGLPISPRTHVGTYQKPEQFDVQHFNDTYKPMEKETKRFGCIFYGMLGTFSTLAILGIAGMISGSKHDTTSIPQKTNNIEVVAKDTLKTDSIKPVMEDAFKLSKKVIKK